LQWLEVRVAAQRSEIRIGALVLRH